MKQNNKKYIRDGRSPLPQNELTSEIMSAIKSKNTKPELLLRKTLWKANIRGYRLHWGKAPGKPDISFPGKKIAIFINGCFWHRCSICQPSMPKSNSEFWMDKFKKNIERDERKISQLKKFGWKVIVIWECQLKNNIIEKVHSIKELLNGKANCN